MSVSQSTLTDRTPSILNKDPADKKPKNDKSSVSLKHEFDPTGLVQRCVIIQRDENGFGLTVSGDNPVFVQLVKEDGAAMRAGVQTGDRIIKVNGTLVTRSNHIEVVKLIKSGSYVALTVLGRPPGLPHIPLEEEEDAEESKEKETEKEKEDGAEVSSPSSHSVPNSPALPGVERRSPSTSSNNNQNITSFLPDGVENKTAYSQKIEHMQRMLTKQQLDLQVKEEECGRNSTPKLLKEIQEAKKHIVLLQEQLSKATAAVIQDGGSVFRTGDAGELDLGLSMREPGSSSRVDNVNNNRLLTNNNSMHSSPLPENPGKRETPCQTPDISPPDGLNFCSSPDTEDYTDTDTGAQCIVGNPPYLLNPQIIGAEDDYFDSQQEQVL